MSKKIFVLNGSSYGKAVEGLTDIEYDTSRFMEDPAKFGLVLFTGGEDITPALYGETSPAHMCYFSPARDKLEYAIFKKARIYGVRGIGICRGVQLLNVIAGGKMYHHVDNHAGQYHNVVTQNNGVIRVNSLHHQMIRPPSDAHVIAYADENRSSKYYGDQDLLTSGPKREPEAVLLPSIECAGAQWHPEMLNDKDLGFKWFHELAKSLLHERDFSKIVKKYTENSNAGDKVRHSGTDG